MICQIQDGKRDKTKFFCETSNEIWLPKYVASLPTVVQTLRAFVIHVKWTGMRLVTDSGTKCALVIHESKAACT